MSNDEQVPAGVRIFQMLDFADEMFDRLSEFDDFNKSGVLKLMMYVEDILDNPGRGWAYQQEGNEHDRQAKVEATRRMDELRIKISKLVESGEYDELLRSLANNYNNQAIKRGVRL